MIDMEPTERLHSEAGDHGFSQGKRNWQVTIDLIHGWKHLSANCAPSGPLNSMPCLPRKSSGTI